ncbi:MAG: Cell division protein FtsZ [Candidatus Falkowbacteria bacterium GW2011_GWA2_39_24]|uniref:Cell division protein FtsZ n=1 Tax=Candidatus Falkowbacteria bacterium GW2011_GWA2_39_24 TaxID=1618634 RepID=A0A0G0NI53_9BACT|nr:MAG: Cell division protein FtsZ [Candidatus Falkowbacteria bacterium GW2011_GWA2_39_24]
MSALGAGMNPELGRQAAEEAQNEIREMLKDANMVFITCGMGGGTGTGASPAIAEIAKDLGALTVAVVTKPFSFEGSQRRNIAERGIAELADKVDAIITIQNDKILQVIDKKTSILDAFMSVDEVLRQGVQGIAEIISVHAMINVDFSDIKSIMANAGSALMGIGRASGENKAVEAAKAAISSPLLEMSIEGAKGILFTIFGGASLTMTEVNEAAKIITSSADEEAKIIFGAGIDEDLKDEIKITVVATGFNSAKGRSTTSLINEEPAYTPSVFIEEEQFKQERMLKKKKSSSLKMAQAEPAKQRPSSSPQEDEDDELGIPAFIRKKMM